MISPTSSDFEKKIFGGALPPNLTLEPLGKFLGVIVAEKLNYLYFVCYKLVICSIRKIVTATKPNHLQSPGMCLKKRTDGLVERVLEIGHENGSIKYESDFCLGSISLITKNNIFWFFWNSDPKWGQSGRSFRHLPVLGNPSRSGSNLIFSVFFLKIETKKH